MKVLHQILILSPLSRSQVLHGSCSQTATARTEAQADSQPGNLNQKQLRVVVAFT